MKIKRRSGKPAGEMFVEYDNNFEEKTRRFKLLKKIIENEPCVTLIVDTNQRTGAQSIEPAELYLQQAQIKYMSMPVKANPGRFFGFGFQPKKTAASEKMLIMEVSGEQFTEELYRLLEHYDLGIGIGMLKNLDETYDQLRVSEESVLFNPLFFKESIYDSIVCSSMRSTMDIRKYVEDIK
jgi:hypothetical protein